MVTVAVPSAFRYASDKTSGPKLARVSSRPGGRVVDAQAEYWSKLCSCTPRTKATATATRLSAHGRRCPWAVFDATVACDSFGVSFVEPSVVTIVLAVVVVDELAECVDDSQPAADIPARMTSQSRVTTSGNEYQRVS